MNDQAACDVLRESGKAWGMVDAAYTPARWMVEAVQTAVAAERVRCAQAADEQWKRNASISGGDAIRALQEGSPSSQQGHFEKNLESNSTKKEVANSAVSSESNIRKAKSGY